jgi:hypothetical protein
MTKVQISKQGNEHDTRPRPWIVWWKFGFRQPVLAFETWQEAKEAALEMAWTHRWFEAGNIRRQHPGGPA